MIERIQKVLARAGVGSRRQVEAWIREGRLAINGAPAQIGARIGPRDRVTLDERPLRLREADSDTRVVIYHRPARPAPGESNTGDEGFDLQSRLPKRAGRRWVPISPLPPNDSGLELLTSDGELAQALMRKFSTMRVEFAVRVRGEPSQAQIDRLQSGIIEGDEAMTVESVEAAGGEGFNRWLKVTTRGGRARDVHRLCAAAGVELSRLMRVAIGPLSMDRSLARERLRALKPHEVEELRVSAGQVIPKSDEKHDRKKHAPDRKRASHGRGKAKPSPKENSRATARRRSAR